MPEYVNIPVRKTVIILLVMILVVIGVKWSHRSNRQTEILRYDRLGLEAMMVGNKLNAISVSPEGPAWTWAQYQPPQDTAIVMAQKRRVKEKSIYSQIDLRGYKFGMTMAEVRANAKRRGDRIEPGSEIQTLFLKDGTQMSFGLESNHVMYILVAGYFGNKSGIKQGCSVRDIKRVYGKPDFVMDSSSGNIF